MARTTKDDLQCSLAKALEKIDSLIEEVETGKNTIEYLRDRLSEQNHSLKRTQNEYIGYRKGVNDSLETVINTLSER